jgi:putative FmdB family regulatory protein
MPTYQYACTNDGCGLRFERVQAFTEEAVSSCPDCDDRVRKVYGSVGVVFKGSGFYRNDSRQPASNGAGSSTGSSESSTSESAATKPAAADKAKSESNGASKPAKASSAESKPSTPVAS